MTPGYLNCPVVLICMCMIVRAKWAMAIEPQVTHNSESENVFNEKVLSGQSNSGENSFSPSTYNNVNLETLENDLARYTNSPSWYFEKSVDVDDSSKENANDEDADDTSNEDNYYVTDAIEKRPSAHAGYTSQLGKRDTIEYGFNGQLGKRPQAGSIAHFGRRTPLGFVSQLGKRVHMGFVSQLGKRSSLGFDSQLGQHTPPQMDFINPQESKAPMGFYSQLGKRAPMGFYSQLGKRAPMGFYSQLGKRAPMGFYSQLGKRAPMGFYSQLGKRAPMGFYSQLGKRAPMGYISQLGKRSESASFISDNSDNSQEHKYAVRKRRASELPWIFSRRQDASNQLRWTNNKNRSSMDTSFDKRPNGNISFFPQKTVTEDDYIYSDK